MNLFYKYLIIVWVGVPILELFTPASSLYDIKYKFYAHGLNFSYLLFFLITMVIGYNISPRKADKATLGIVPINKRKVLLFIKVSTYLSIIGLFSMAIDKIVIQGIDYTNGIAIAKYQLIETAENRSGPSSIFSVIGYLLIGFCFWSLSMIIVFYEELTKRIRSNYLFLNVFAIFLSSFLTGGRTNLIIMVSFGVGSQILRNILLKNKSIFTKKNKIYFYIFVFFTIVFIMYVFNSRAISNNIEAQVYSETAIFWMEGTPTHHFYRIEKLPTEIAQIVYLSLIMIVYLVHSIWILEGTIYIHSLNGDATFVGIKNALSKLNLCDKPLPWEYAGKFIGWPGGLFHDYGLIGVASISILHGLIFGLNIRTFNNIGIINFVLYLLLFSIIITAPFIIFIDLLMIPSVLISAVFLCLFSEIYKNLTITPV